MLLALSSLFETAALPIAFSSSDGTDITLTVNASENSSIISDEILATVPASIVDVICSKSMLGNDVGVITPNLLLSNSVAAALAVVDGDLTVSALITGSSSTLGVLVNSIVGSSLITSNGQLSSIVPFSEMFSITGDIVAVGKWMPNLGVSISTGSIPLITITTISEPRYLIVEVSVSFGNSSWRLIGNASAASSVSNGSLEALAFSVSNYTAKAVVCDKSLLTGTLSAISSITKTAAVNNVTGVIGTVLPVVYTSRVLLPNIDTCFANQILLNASISNHITASISSVSGEWLYAFWYTVHRAFNTSDKVPLSFIFVDKALPTLTKIEKESTINGRWRIETI